MAVALKVSTSLRVKPTPVAVMLTAGPPAAAEVGLTVNSTGDTVNGAAAERATPEFETVRGKVPERARSSGVMSARSWVALIKVVPIGVLAQFTTDEGTKPLPATVNRNPTPPASTGLGERDAMVGTARMSKAREVADARSFTL